MDDRWKGRREGRQAGRQADGWVGGRAGEKTNHPLQINLIGTDLIHLN